MAHKAWIKVFLFCAVASLPLGAQERQPGARVVRVPFERGVYFEAPSGTVALHSSMFVPSQSSGLREYLSIGRDDAIAEMPGAHAAVQITNTRPTFYVRGYRAGTRVYLVRVASKEDYREVRLSTSRHLRETPAFKSRDLVDIEMALVGDDLVTVRPRTNLAPGEYAIVSYLEPRYRQLRQAFEFGVMSRTSGP